MTGKVLPALSVQSSRRSSENGAADLTFFFQCGVWGLGRGRKGFWLPAETCLLLMVSDGLRPRD